MLCLSPSEGSTPRASGAIVGKTKAPKSRERSVESACDRAARQSGRNRERVAARSIHCRAARARRDGLKLAFVNGIATAGEGTIYVVNVDGSNQRHVAQDASDPVWQPVPVRKR